MNLPSSPPALETLAVVLNAPEEIVMQRLPLTAPTAQDIVVDVEWSGISTGTERLLWSGKMPPFPGLAYPLVPGYESVGRVISSGTHSGRQVGERVFVPGARCYGEVRGLFGGASGRVVVPGSRVVALSERVEEQGVLLALAATAQHALSQVPEEPPDLIVGHGVLGRVLARLTLAAGHAPPTVWEKNPMRAAGATGYRVMSPDEDTRKDYRVIYDVSGDAGILDMLIGRLAPKGVIVLAGFYSERLSFSFPAAFMREARIRIAAEWQPKDVSAVQTYLDAGTVSLDGLITHREQAVDAPDAYKIAFKDPTCLKMVLDWRKCQ